MRDSTWQRLSWGPPCWLFRTLFVAWGGAPGWHHWPLFSSSHTTTMCWCRRFWIIVRAKGGGTYVFERWQQIFWVRLFFIFLSPFLCQFGFFFRGSCELFSDMSFFEGSGWMYYIVVSVQGTINTGVGIGSILLAGDCLKVCLLNSLHNCFLFIFTINPNTYIISFSFLSGVVSEWCFGYTTSM